MKRFMAQQQAFEDFNRRYFRGRLPSYRVIVTERFRTRMAGTWYGESDDATRTIRLRAGLPDHSTGTALRDPSWPKVLLHEMCHIGHPGHGKRWQARMQKLAHLGEEWARTEAAEYRGQQSPKTSLTAEIKKCLEDLTSQRELPSWRSALRATAYELGRPGREILHIAPWAPSVWKRLARERREFDRIQADIRKRFGLSDDHDD